MINNQTIVGDNYFTAGFTFQNPSPLTLTCSGGEYVLTELDGNERKLVFEPFEIDIVPDTELPVMYDIYLLTNGTYYVSRVELGLQDIAVYEGEEELQSILCNILVPPNTTDLAEVPINVYKITLSMDTVFTIMDAEAEKGVVTSEEASTKSEQTSTQAGTGETQDAGEVTTTIQRP